MRDLGVTFQSLWKEYTKRASITCPRLRIIRHLLTTEAAMTILHAFFCLRVDYGDAVYIGLTV